MGQLHKIGTPCFSNYASEITYHKNTCRLYNNAIFDDILARCLSNNTISNEFCGYWQGSKRVAERFRT
ncbi:hypothetical protein [Campylobacter concisus]|uniref:hypothetical protein n=1 Tax=Campylobacter concisus TaxID=199 RepID=UPI00112FC119|nr:hypothetical protein [Campylobacter concisus]